MLDGNDRETFFSIRLLRDVVDRREKPILLWLGAGTSMWCGFPNWQEVAETFHQSYGKFERSFDKAQGVKLIQSGRFPELFEIFRKVNPQRYNRQMVDTFGSRAPTPVYRRFLSIAKQITPLQIVTTNVDESLERNLPKSDAVQKSDLERCIDLLVVGKSFIAKLHGSVSSVESTVFTTTDYENLKKDAAYLNTLQNLFAQSTVIFLGYSLRDEYVLNLLLASSEARPLFGDGPHFLVRTGETRDLPNSIKTIRYLPEPFADHRSAICVLDIVRVVKNGGHIWFAPQNESALPEKKVASAYFITDIVPPGVWATSQSLTLQPGPDKPPDFLPNAIVGQGFNESELPERNSPAMHDLTVGMVSFDYVHAPLSCAGRLHDLLGSGIFWELVRGDLFRFIHFEYEPAMMFTSTEAVSGGDIAQVGIQSEPGKFLTIEEQIRRQFRSASGHESEADKLYEILRAKTFTFDSTRFNIPNLTRGALLHPSVRSLLGISEAILPTSLPRWVTFPVLRLAHTIVAGCACEDLSLPATKIGFGSEMLVGAAFSVSAARDWADSVSSYVLTSRFNTELGAYIQSNPSAFTALLKFRDTQSGMGLRREIMDHLATNAGAEFTASVNAGLRQIIPTTVMDNAHNELSALLLRRESDPPVVPAVWTNVRNSDSIARLWRARSRKELEEYCRLRGIKKRSQCPCESGEKLESCCAQALSD